ncbi:MAG: hypothetical protein ABFD50_09055 [Smithella sp.]
MSNATTAQAIRAMASYYSTPVGAAPLVADINEGKAWEVGRKRSNYWRCSRDVWPIYKNKRLLLKRNKQTKWNCHDSRI